MDSSANAVIGWEQAKLAEQNYDFLERLKVRKANLQESLTECNDAIQALEANPEVARVLKLLAKAGVNRY